MKTDDPEVKVGLMIPGNHNLSVKLEKREKTVWMIEALEKQIFCIFFFYLGGGGLQDNAAALIQEMSSYAEALEQMVYSLDTGSWEIWRGYIFVPF